MIYICHIWPYPTTHQSTTKPWPTNDSLIFGQDENVGSLVGHKSQDISNNNADGLFSVSMMPSMMDRSKEGEIVVDMDTRKRVREHVYGVVVGWSGLLKVKYRQYCRLALSILFINFIWWKRKSGGGGAIRSQWSCVIGLRGLRDNGFGWRWRQWEEMPPDSGHGDRTTGHCYTPQCAPHQFNWLCALSLWRQWRQGQVGELLMVGCV